MQQFKYGISTIMLLLCTTAVSMNTEQEILKLEKERSKQRQKFIKEINLQNAFTLDKSVEDDESVELVNNHNTKLTLYIDGNNEITLPPNSSKSFDYLPKQIVHITKDNSFITIKPSWKDFFTSTNRSYIFDVDPKSGETYAFRKKDS